MGNTQTKLFRLMPSGSQENTSINEEAVEPFLPLLIAEAGRQFLEGRFPELQLEEWFKGVTACHGELPGGSVADHEELPRALTVSVRSGVVHPESEVLERDIWLEPHEAK